MAKHNHVTRDIKARGLCPACDEYRRTHPSPRGSYAEFAADASDPSGFVYDYAPADYTPTPTYDYGSSSSPSTDSGSFGGDGGSF